MKTCNTCNQNKSLELFGKRTASKDGLKASCKDCVRKSRIKQGYMTGEGVKGEKNPFSKLTEKEVLLICKLLRTGKHTHYEIAEMVGCARTTITAINNGQNWRCVTDEAM